MPRLVAFSGTHCSGKTTLANALGECLRGKGFKVAVVKEVVRRCPYPVNELGGYLAQEWIIKEELKEYRSAAAGDSDFAIFDRTAYDHLVYSAWLFLHDRISFQKLRILFGLVEAARPRYDKIFYLEPLPLVGDGFRSESKKYQADIDGLLREFLRANRIEATFVPNHSLEARLELVRKHLGV